MNAKKNLIVAVMTAFVAAGAFAQEATPAEERFYAEVPSVKTREQVKAELQQARAEGQQLAVFSGEASTFPNQPATATARSREDVKRETISALRQNRFSAPINIGG
ncbi:DUF4148 domain-containing protein [Caldimonas brevitalea]|uniref:DUF4148 domain-containing protein n=1 Tax=Caldimonas brevitalea TaxID=413882 RepID=A0A0G3BK71_9BURK|nr:DUF4148 domain-containing protein [Caldimonas brevitalea]AKJ26950.1 hypothetical protein AAW51_0259 [Caldimonas brevitalea]